jgi:hypothetical protein
MDPMNLTIIVVGCSFVAFWVGKIIGTLRAYHVGYSDGAAAGTAAAINALGKQLDLDISYDLVIKEDNKDND